MKRVLLTRNTGWSGVLLSLWVLTLIMGFSSRVCGQTLGPQGGSYHFIGSLGYNAPSIHAEWLVMQDGLLKGTLYTTKNGVRSPGALQAPDTIEAWISAHGREGFSAEKIIIRAENRNPLAQRIQYSVQLPDKLNQVDLYIAVPEFKIGSQRFLFAGPVFLESTQKVVAP